VLPPLLRIEEPLLLPLLTREGDEEVLEERTPVLREELLLPLMVEREELPEVPRTPLLLVLRVAFEGL
jgi:hypothetical protein